MSEIHDVKCVLKGRYKKIPLRPGEYNCWTYVQKVLKENNQPVPDFPIFGFDLFSLNKSFENAFKNTLYRKINVPKKFDICTFKKKKFKRTFYHCGVFICNDVFAHINQNEKHPILDHYNSVKREYDEATIWRRY